MECVGNLHLSQLLPNPITIPLARVIQGSSRGRKLGVPTINVDPICAPKVLQYGIYACWIVVGRSRYRGAMHFGPRPVFKDSDSFEVHILDAAIDDVPAIVTIEVVARIRDITDFPSAQALMERIAQDIAEVRAILGDA